MVPIESFKIFVPIFELLNKRLPKDWRLDSDELFDQMDLNHVGEVNLEQFSNVFNTL
jgi:hypothetical protein